MATDLCRCGHDLAAHSGSGVAGIPWFCTGWQPATQGEEVDAHGTGRPTVQEEIERLRAVAESARFADADAPEPWRSKSDAANELRRALAALDQAAQREDDQ